MSLPALLLLALATPLAPQPDDHLLVGYDFDGSDVETGPYTVMVFQDAQGSVKLSTQYRYSGQRSVEIRDVAGDGDFAELQGYFPERTEGTLYLHFALMTAEPDEGLNVALAGRSHFVLEKDGIAFWLEMRDGMLWHHTGGETEPLFRPVRFTWYLVDVAYRVDPGRYDLAIREEGRPAPLIELSDQANAVGLAGSSVFKFSFIGDPPGVDRSNVRFYVDDVFLSADQPVEQAPFVAPGRRMLFIDLWQYYRFELLSRPRCPPVLDHGDFGLLDGDLRQLTAAGLFGTYDALARPGQQVPPLPESPPGYLGPVLEGMALWRRGCAAPEGCKEAPCAADFFHAAAERVPQAKLYPMSEVLALANAERWEEADALWMAIYPDWVDDPRFPALAATLGLARGAWDEVEALLDQTLEEDPQRFRHPLIRRLWSGELGPDLAGRLAEAFPGAWVGIARTALTAEHRYYVLLWQGKTDAAEAYAGRMVERFRAMGLAAGRWLERRGDARFYRGDLEAARASYEAALEEIADPTPVLLKLSDVHFRRGDLELERRYREAIYGRLRQEEK